MSNITQLANTIDTIKNKFNLDDIDIQILGVMSAKWDGGRDVRVTDLTLKFGKTVASPASIHYRLTKDLVDLKFIKLQQSEEDARVKFVVKGTKFDALEEYLGGIL